MEEPKMSLPRLAMVVSLSLITALAPRPALAQRAEIPLTNWTVPPYTRSAPTGIRTMADVTPGIGFVGVDPCRIVDTRGPAGPYGAPSLAAGAPRDFDLDGGPCAGIPPGVEAYSLNVTVTNTAGPGFILIFPQGGTAPGVSTLNYVAGDTLANAAIVPAGTGGGVTVVAGVSGTDLILDINGYFTDEYNSGVQFAAIGSMGGDGMIVGTNSAAVADSAGVTGSATGAARSYGVLGIKPGNSNGAAGVKGVQGAAVASAPGQAPAGVVGTSPLFDGVLGITIAGSGGAGVKGLRTSGAAGILSSGELGVANLGGNFVNDVDIDGDLTVACIGGFGCDLVANSGTKMFVEPHPSDASKVIKYVSLEGPESGTYFRGRGHFQNGIARITVPENFRFVTSPDGLTVQITPIGGMATVGVLRMNLDEIVVQSSRNLEFSYLVQGVRRAFADHRPIQDAGMEYVRRGATSRLHERFPAELRRRLIANGTYNPDGTVNMDTARRLGWDRIWEERDRPEPAPQ